ncbi:MAG: hypothetical protein EOO09_21905 [Chitinophagaceae bacterium]|nr:MAG: hypothetical protein EOO09_21905 [Chitinophagaceae bacterium]
MKHLLFLIAVLSASVAFAQKSYSGFGKFPVDPVSGAVVFDTIMTARDPRMVVYGKTREYLGTAIPGLKEGTGSQDSVTGKISGEATLGFGYSHLYVVKEKKKTSQLTNAVTGKIHFRYQVTAMDQKLRLVIDHIKIIDTSVSATPQPVNLAAFNSTLQKAASEELVDQVEAKNSFARYESLYAVLGSFISGLSGKLMFKPLQ